MSNHQGKKVPAILNIFNPVAFHHQTIRHLFYGFSRIEPNFQQLPRLHFLQAQFSTDKIQGTASPPLIELSISSG